MGLEDLNPWMVGGTLMASTLKVASALPKSLIWPVA